MKKRFICFFLSVLLVFSFGYQNVAYALDEDVVHILIQTGASKPICAQTNECFNPSKIVIDVGTEVIWTNLDAANHIISSGKPEKLMDGGYQSMFDGHFQSGKLANGETFSYKFSEVGEYYYHSWDYAWATGVVIVEDLQEQTGSLSPLKQYKSGIQINEIKCKDNLQLITKYNGFPACVKDSSIVSLIVRGWAELSDFTITKGFFTHTITNGKITSLEYHGPQNCAFVVVKLQSQDDGNLIIFIPRKIIDVKFGEADDNFIVLADGQEVDYEEIDKDTNQRTLSIPFEEGSEIIEIIKACPI